MPGDRQIQDLMAIELQLWLPVIDAYSPGLCGRTIHGFRLLIMLLLPCLHALLHSSSILLKDISIYFNQSLINLFEMPSFVLQITGNADLPKLAEQANLRISTSSTGLNKQFVSDEVLTTAKYIEDMIIQVQTRAKSVDPEGLAVAHWSQTSLSTNSWIEHHPRPHVQGYDRTGSPFPVSGLFARNVGGSNSDTAVVPVRRYRARIEFDVRFRDFALLSDFSSHLTSLEHCEIESLEWVLLPETQEEYKSQLRLKAAQDARAKVKDYCQVVCPHEDVTIIPTELIGENISGGLFSGAGRLRDNYSHSFGVMSGASLFGTNKLGVGASTDPTPSAELSFAPQVINMTLAVIFKFMVETNGFKLSSI